MQSQYTSNLKPPPPIISSISLESTRTREPISNTISSSSSLDNSSQNRNNTSQPYLKKRNLFQDDDLRIGNIAAATNSSTTTQQILIDEGTIDCLSLSVPSSRGPFISSTTCPTNFLKVYKNTQDDDEDEDDEVDQLRIDEGIEQSTPTIITNKSLLSSHDTVSTKMNSNHSSSILDTLISSTNGPSCATINGSAIIVNPLMSNNLSHNFPYLTSTIANSPSRGGFLDRLFTFSPNATHIPGTVAPMNTPPKTYQDRVSLFTSTPHKVENLSSPNGSTHSNGYSSNLTNSLMSNDESPNFSNVWLNHQQGKSSFDPIGKIAFNPPNATNLLSTSNVNNNHINNRQPKLVNNGNNLGLMDTLVYSNQINTSPPSHQHHHNNNRNLSLIPAGIQKHTINQKELRRAREKTKNNLKHFLIDSAASPSDTNHTNAILTDAKKNAIIHLSSPTSSSEEPEEEPIPKLPSPESAVPLKQKLKMRSYKLL